MKTFLLSLITLFLLDSGMAQTTCPTQFLRNNGNAKSCASHIRLYYGDCPVNIPTLDSIKVNGVLQPETFTLLETVCHGSNIYSDFCISDDNLQPAHRITVYITYTDGKSGEIVGRSVCDVPEANLQPVVLTEFKALKFGNNVKLDWITEQEIGFSRFEIERSFGSNNFETIGTVLAEGQGGMKQTYSFTDYSNISAGVTYYRLKMIDKDGKFAWSDTRAIKSTETADFSIYPNPSSGSVKIDLGKISETMEISVLDISGRIIQKVELKTTGSTSINDLKKGYYFVRITGKQSGTSIVKKLTVLD